MTYYLVIKNGVYSQGVYHVGTDLEAAKKAALRLAIRDVDNYHTWDVYRSNGGVATQVTFGVNKVHAEKTREGV